MFEAHDGAVELALDGPGVSEHEIELFSGVALEGLAPRVEMGGFESARAGKAPHAAGDFGDELEFEFAGRFAVGGEIGEELVELGRIFAGEEDVFGSEAVTE